jgi:hypothetical protein
MASSAAQDEIFRADKQLDPSKKTRNFSSFHTEQGGPIVHMSRPPTADVALHAGLRHSHADSGECSNVPQIYSFPIFLMFCASHAMAQ